jgi:organic hydroperoxide reductase OsmC/OhrA
MKEHSYAISIRWAGNTGKGTQSYSGYSRNHEIQSAGKLVIPGSSDPSFRGDRSRYNPEELLVASLSACHMLWYLHLCADSGIVVTGYEDDATGTMVETPNGGGRFQEVTLKPRVAVEPGADLERCRELHERAHHLCFIANSVNFPVHCQAETIVSTGTVLK